MSTWQICAIAWFAICFLAVALILWSYTRHRKQESLTPFMRLHRAGEWFCFTCLGCGTSWFWPAKDRLTAHPGIVREAKDHTC